MSNVTPIKTKTHANLSEMLLKAGIADSRVPDLRRALIDTKLLRSRSGAAVTSSIYVETASSTKC